MLWSDFSENTIICISKHIRQLLNLLDWEVLQPIFLLQLDLPSVLGPTAPGRPCPNWLSKCPWKSLQSLTTCLAMSFHLVLAEVYFAATCDGFLSVLCLLWSLSLGGKTAMRFPSAPTNVFFPIYTDPVPFFSSAACLGPLTILLERHQFVIKGHWH